MLSTLRTKGHGFFLEIDLQLMFSFLVVDMEDYRYQFL